MGTKKSDEIYTNLLLDNKVLIHSKEGNTSGQNNAKTISDLINKMNSDSQKESE